MTKKRNKRKQQRPKALTPQKNPPDKTHTGTPDNPSASHHASIQIRREATITSGPLPAPEVLREYDQIVPGLATRIVTMAEQQADHRRYLERTVVDSNVKRERAGSVSGPVLFVVVLIFGGYLASLGYPGWAITTVVADLVGFIGLIAWGYREGRGMLTKKREEAPPPPE